MDASRIIFQLTILGVSVYYSQAVGCQSSLYRDLFIPESYFVDGQIIATDYSGFSTPRLARTEPPNVGRDILGYDGNDFTIKNSFDIDRHPRTQDSGRVKFVYEISCNVNLLATWTVTITNENDEVPRLSDGILSDSFYIDVSELATPGTVLPFTFRNKIVDVDPGDTVTFSMRMYPSSAEGSFPFRMINTLDEGDIQINGTLDYELGQRQYVYQVFADDTAGHRLTVILVIRIKDGDDQDPVFTESVYTLTILEDVGVGTRHSSSPVISAYDQDVAIDTDLTFSLVSGHTLFGTTYFDIDGTSGEIIVRTALDRERTAEYSLIIKVEERYNSDKSATARLTITIEDTNDTPPSFTRQVYVVSLPEHSTQGTLVTEVAATDADLDSVLNFELVNLSDLFDIVKTRPGTAEVILINSDLLDRETTPRLTLAVTVSDRVATVTTRVEITLTDINDQTPTFSLSVYTFPPVNETAPVGRIVGQVAATDRDTGRNSQVRYRIIQVTDGRNGQFSINPSTGVIKVAGNLTADYIPFYELRVEVYDQGTPSLSSVATVRVSVIDQNTQRPQFYQTEYELQVREDAQVGSTLLQLQATDADAGTTILYYMSATWQLNTSPENRFRVINYTGEVLLTSPLDREMDATFKFQVTAFDGYYYSFPAATVDVIVIDVNDNEPLFDDTYRFTISEGCDHRRLGQLNAIDIDDGRNAEINYFVNGNEYFIEPTRGLLNVTRCLDREVQSTVSVMVYAHDRGLPQRTGSTLVSVSVTDINDNKPVFTQSQYILSYREGFQGNIDLPEVLDTDLPPYDEYSISMISGDNSYFSLVDEHIELLQPLDVPPGILLSEYTIGLKVVNTAAYTGPPVPDSTATLLLQVTSVNTHDPQFTRTVYYVRILENVPVGTNLLTLSASDGDGDEILFYFSNSTLSQMQDMFWLDGETGVISLKRSVDAEESSLSGPYVFRVEAHDPYGRFTTAVVNVTVLDINDNPPIITTDDVEVGVSESRAVGYVLPVLVSVSDRDSGRHGEVTCTVEPAIYLDIHSCTTVTLVRQVDFEEVRLLETIITATDSGAPPLSSTHRITVNVLPENDNFPIFELSSYTFNVSENIPGRFAVGTVRATDSDRDNITYSLQPPDVRDYFSINALGLLYAIRPLDREEKEEHGFNVIASDGLLTTAVRATIHVIDQNDNPPIFRPDVGIYYINENEPNDNVFQVIASDDLDIGINADVVYEILSGNDDGIFSINNKTGVVSVRQPGAVDHEAKNEYKLILQARDRGYPTQYATIGITIRVLDVNEYAPQFGETQYTATIAENSTPGTLLAQVTASDRDGNNRITFSMNETTDLIINSRGIIMIAELIDGDVDNYYNTTVSACDDSGLCSHVPLYVYLTDVNDNVPKFAPLHAELNVTEDTPRGTLLLSASGTDVDRDDKLTYWITGGASLFSINSSTGLIHLSGAPRATEQAVYDVSIFVSDGPHQTRAELTVNIQEANLYTPMFSKFVYNTIICETDTLYTEIMEISVQDDDDGVDGQVDVTIISGDWNNTFAIRPDQEVENTFHLVNILPLMFDERLYFELELQAADNARYPRYDTSRVTIRLLSGSRSPPVLQPVVSGDVTVSDTAKRGDIVYTFVALHKSSEERQTLRFSIAPADSSYDINEITGHLMLNTENPVKSTTIDVSACATTSSECVGGLSTQLCSTISVSLYVKDEPQLPKFYPSAYFVGNITENVYQVPILEIYANQSSGDAVNITIIYNELYGSLFELIDKIVWSVAPLDREYQDAYNLLVIGHGDSGVTTANIHIAVLDVNDEPPVFVFSEFREATTESRTYPGHVITVVSVTDDDFDPENKQVVFTILPSPHSHLFRLEQRGQDCDVILTEQLDADVPSNESVATVVYSINITAYDPTNTSMITTATVQVLVRDDNDNTPTFTQDVYTFVTEEESPPSSVITLGTVRAVDIDRVDIGRLHYGILEDTNIIVIDVLYGQIYLNQTVDKEEISHLTFTVQAFDSVGHVGNATVEIEITDRNDNAPSFLNSTFDFDVNEGPESLTAIRLLITDADFHDNSMLTFTKAGLSCGMFNLDGRQLDEHMFELMVESVTEMDRENNSVPHLSDGTAVYSCIIMARDNGTIQLSTSKMISMYVHDINDRPPQFTPPLFEWAMTEVSPVNFTIGTLTATDADFNQEYIQIKYGIIHQETSLFALDEDSGIMYLSRQIESRTTEIRSHDINVTAYDPTEPERLRDEAIVRVHVLDSNDHAPVFSQIRYIFTISKKSTTDYVGKVSASDNDTDSWNSHIDYSIQFFNRELPFTIDPDTGVITSQLATLDSSATFLFGLVAQDRGIPKQRGSAIVEIKVIAFSTSSYQGTVAEGSVYNQTVDIRPPIYAVDAGSVTSILYTLQPQDGFGIFGISSETGIVFIKIRDPQMLDYEGTKHYYLQVVAGDQFGSGVGANLTISLIDQNDNPPVFSQSSYNFTVSENSHNLVLGRVTTTDVDTNPQTLYRIVGDPGPFIIDTDTGTLRVIGGLDVEANPVYHFQVEARDRENTELFDTSMVVIAVQDINDNSPVFTEDVYSWKVAENADIGAVVGIVAAGDVENDTVVFSISNSTSGESPPPFIIGRLNGEISVSEKLDHEQKSQYRFTIMAADSTLQNFTQVLVVVTDVNDNPPKFSDRTYYGSVTEQAAHNSVVMVVFATDADEKGTNNSKVSYGLSGSGSGYFHITEHGIIRVESLFTKFQLQEEGIVTEDDNTISLTVSAKDYGQPALESTADVVLRLQDQFEDVPKFEETVYDVEINEHLPLGTKIATVMATVKEDSQNIVIVYRLIGSNPAFTMIDSTSGDIYTQTVLDRELAGYFIYTVEAVDNRSPPKIGYVTVTITLLDINDHSPEFDSEKLEFSRPEGTYINVLLTTVYASDPDLGRNSEVTYSIIGTSQAGLFSINSTGGEIWMNGLLDYEVVQQFHLTVEAIDNGIVRRTDKLDIFVYLTDVNDNAPIFQRDYGPYSIKENVRKVTVARMTATDLDSAYNGQVYYSLISGDEYGDFILQDVNDTAVLTLRDFLNYENVPQYNLTVIAYDLGRPRRTTEMIVQVDVQDVSDSKPIFSRPLYEIFIPDNTTIGTLLINLTAGYGDFEYFITDGNFNDEFDLNKTTGQLVINKDIDGGSEYQLVIQAIDFYIPPSPAYTLVKVVVEESDPKPRFAKDTYAGYVTENVPAPVEIIDLTTSDEQRGRAVRYEIIAGNANAMFALDEFTGRLYSNIEFDREATEIFRVTIQAFRVDVLKKRYAEVATSLTYRQRVLLDRLQHPDYLSTMFSHSQVNTPHSDVSHAPTFPQTIFNHTRLLAADSDRRRRAVARSVDTTIVEVTVRDVNDNSPQFDTKENIGIPDTALQGDTVTFIRASDPDAGDNATIAYALTQSSAYFRIVAGTGAVILLSPSITLSQYDLSVEAVDNNGHTSGQRVTKKFRLIVTKDESRVSYTALIPLKNLPTDVQLAANLSRILGADVRIESTESVSDTHTNITMFAFADKDTMMSKSDLLDAINTFQVDIDNYFANISDIFTVTAKPIISSGAGGATDLAFIIMGMVVGAAALFGILLLTIYWKQRVMAEQKGDQGDLIEDTGEDGDADSGVLELADEPAADNAANMDIQNGFNPHVMNGMNPMMMAGMNMMYPGVNQQWMNPAFQMQQMPPQP